MNIELIIKDLEHTIKYFEKPNTEVQSGRVMQAKKTLEQIKLLNIPVVPNRFCNCEGHKYSETEKCNECGKPLPPY